MISSPLRYPGGKAKLLPVVADLIRENGLFNCCYIEPYAGGAGLAIKLLSEGFVDRIVLNDIDVAIWSFWKSAFEATDEFCRRIDSVDISVDEWRRQREVYDSSCADPLDLGFATYFLNRTSRSGILDGSGPIGGYEQLGEWKIDARFNKVRQIKNIQYLSALRDKVSLENKDAVSFLSEAFDNKDAFLYLDPPYYVKGSKLYKNFYGHDDHAQIANILLDFRDENWIVSYDDVEEIRNLYAAFRSASYNLNYSAGASGKGREVMFFSDRMRRGEMRKVA